MQNTKFLILLLNLFVLAASGFQIFEGNLEIISASLRPGISVPHPIIGTLTTDEPATYNLLFSSNVETKTLTSKTRVSVSGKLLGLPKPLNLTQSVRFWNKPIIEVYQISVISGQDNSRQLPSELNVAIILVATREHQPVLDTAGAADLITQVSSLYSESSWNSFTFNVDADGNGQPDVFGPYTVDYDPSLCEFSLWSDSAYTMAGNDGVQLDRYANFVYIMNSFSPCAAGWGVIGCEPFCNAWIFIPFADAIAHELGHNIGLNHASTDYNNDGFIDEEYADTSCIMGYSAVPLRQFNAIHKELAGWIPSSNILTGIEDNTTITISALSAPLSSYPVSVKIPWNGINYVVSFRSTYGFDANLQLYTPSFDNRVTIHRETTNAYSLLVKILNVGESYNFGVQVTFLGYQDQLAQVELLYGIPVPIPPIPCTYRWECAAYSQDYNFIDCITSTCICLDTFTKVDGICSCELDGVYWTPNGSPRCLSAGQCVLDYYGPDCHGPCTNYNVLGIGECSA